MDRSSRNHTNHIARVHESAPYLELRSGSMWRIGPGPDYLCIQAWESGDRIQEAPAIWGSHTHEFRNLDRYGARGPVRAIEVEEWPG